MENDSLEMKNDPIVPISNCSEPSLSCKLTTAELQQRKATVLTSLRNQVLEKKELPNGYAFRFNGSDEMINKLAEFVKTERACCEFFTFQISVAGNAGSCWLEITGDTRVKEFIVNELEM
jgi:hypothetical protein